MKTETKIENVSSFKLKVEIQARSQDEKVVDSLSEFSADQLKEELKRRHGKNDATVKIDLNDTITDVYIEGKTKKIGFLFVRLFSQHKELREIVKASLMTAEMIPTGIFDLLNKGKIKS
jgi:hypothetical protein